MTLRRPRVGADPRPPTRNLVKVRKSAAPPGEEPIVWRLSTTHRFSRLQEAAWLVDICRRRWIIAQVFRTLKSQGLALEASFLADGDGQDCLAATALVAACRVMQLGQGPGEAGATIPASRVLHQEETAVLPLTPPQQTSFSSLRFRSVRRLVVCVADFAGISIASNGSDVSVAAPQSQ